MSPGACNQKSGYSQPNNKSGVWVLQSDFAVDITRSRYVMLVETCSRRIKAAIALKVFSTKY